MNISEQAKELRAEDPLFSRVKKIEKPIFETQPAQKPAARSRHWTLAAVAGGAVLLFLGYYLYQAQQQIEKLHANLAQSRNQLSAVTQELQKSGEKIGDLAKGLSQSQSNLKAQKGEINRYKNLYAEVKGGLETVSQQKADQSQVESLKTELKTETSQLKENLQTVNNQVGQANSNISDLREISTRNRTDIESTREALASVRQTADTTAGQLSEVKRSLEREVYNFELQEKGGIMKVFNVALGLKDVDFLKQRYDLEIVAGGKRIKKDNHPINEPIYFYIEGVKKAYEIVITKVDKKYVVGYLSVPKA